MPVKLGHHSETIIAHEIPNNGISRLPLKQPHEVDYVDKKHTMYHVRLWSHS